LRTFCAHASVLRKYPLLPSSKEDATMADFSAMFAPVTGEVWKFVGALGEVLVKDGPLWKPKDPSKKPELSRELLEFVNRAQKISDAFFTGGSPQAQLIYTLRPKLDSAFAGSNLELELDGRPYIWTSQLQKQFSWPAPPGTKETGAVARIHLGSTVVVPFASEGGPWGIFRIMADAEPREVGSRLVEWKYVRGGNGRLEAIQPAPVRLEIVDFPGGADLFNPKFFANFQCPARAVQ
jgi:type VI protein secretion system component VasK